MGTTWCDNHKLPRIFKDRRRRSSVSNSYSRLRHKCPYLRTIRFQGRTCLTKKRQLFLGPAPMSPSSLPLPAMADQKDNRSPQPGSGMLTRFPFASCGVHKLVFRHAPHSTAFACSLGSPDPCSSAVHMEPFSTSALKVLI